MPSTAPCPAAFAAPPPEGGRTASYIARVTDCGWSFGAQSSTGRPPPPSPPRAPRAPPSARGPSAAPNRVRGEQRGAGGRWGGGGGARDVVVGAGSERAGGRAERAGPRRGPRSRRSGVCGVPGRAAPPLPPRGRPGRGRGRQRGSSVRRPAGGCGWRRALRAAPREEGARGTVGAPDPRGGLPPQGPPRHGAATCRRSGPGRGGDWACSLGPGVRGRRKARGGRGAGAGGRPSPRAPPGSTARARRRPCGRRSATRRKPLLQGAMGRGGPRRLPRGRPEPPPRH